MGPQAEDSIRLGTDVCASSDTTPTANYTSSSSTAKPPNPSTKPSHRRGRPSIDKSQVSAPFPVLSHDERRLFDAIASGNTQTRAQGIPKAAEKKVRINAPKSTKSTPLSEPKVSTDAASQSWYTPAPVQSLTESVLQRSASDATPRTRPSEVDLGRTNSTKEFRTHLHTESEARRDCVEPAKRRVHKHLIKHSDCPWIESTNDPYALAGYLAQHRPLRSMTRGSYESDETAVDIEAPTPMDAKEGEVPLLVKSVENTLRPTARLVSKPLPNLPVSDTFLSRWAVSTDSVRSKGEVPQCEEELFAFPVPPGGIPNAFNDREDLNSLSTPPVFASLPNPSSSSVATITPTTPLNPSVKPLTLKAAPKPKVATVVHQNPGGDHSYTHFQDSLVIRDGRAYPQASMKGSIHTSIRPTGTTPTLRRRSISATPSRNRNPPNGPRNLYALVYGPQSPQAEKYERDLLERQEREKGEHEEFEWDPSEWGVIREYKGKPYPDVDGKKRERRMKQERKKELERQKKRKELEMQKGQQRQAARTWL